MADEPKTLDPVATQASADAAPPPAEALKPDPAPKPVATPAVPKKKSFFAAISEAMGSQRKTVRIWAWLFITSVIGLGATSYGLFKIWLRHKEIQAEIKKQQEVSPEELAKKIEAAKKLEGDEYLARNLSLGVFQFQMKKMSSEPEPHDIQNIAQIEISVLCDSLSTKEYILSHLQLVKDGITQALIGFSRKDLMSSEGKKSVQEKILIKVNVSLPEGRVERVFFTKLILS